MDRIRAQHNLDFAMEFKATLAGPKGQEASEQLEPHYQELQDSLNWFIENHDRDKAQRFASLLWRFWMNKGHVAEGRRLMSKIVNTTPTNPIPSVYGEILYGAGMLAFRQNDNEEAKRLFKESLALGREKNDKMVTVNALTGLARTALRDGNYADVKSTSEEARNIARDLKDDYAETRPLHMLAAATRMEGDLQRAQFLYEEDLALARKIGDEALVSTELDNLGSVSLHLGNLKKAKDMYREAAERVYKNQDKYMLPYVPLHFSMVALEEGKHDRAVKLLGASEVLFESSGMSPDPDEAVERDNMIARLRKAVDESEFKKHWAEGRKLSLDETVHYSLEKLKVPYRCNSSPRRC